MSSLLFLPSSVRAGTATCDSNDHDPQEGGQRNRVSGRVLDCEGRPLSGVCVALYSPVGSSSHREEDTTDNSGVYSFSSSPNGSATGFNQFGLGVGKDAYRDGNFGYFSRVKSPSFRFLDGGSDNCGRVNCGYAVNIDNTVPNVPQRLSYAVWGVERRRI